MKPGVVESIPTARDVLQGWQNFCRLLHAIERLSPFFSCGGSIWRAIQKLVCYLLAYILAH